MSHPTNTTPSASSRSTSAVHGLLHSTQRAPGSAGKKPQPQGPDKDSALLTSTGTHPASVSRLNAVDRFPAPPRTYGRHNIVASAIDAEAAAAAKIQSDAAAKTDAANFASRSRNPYMRRKLAASFCERRREIHLAAVTNIHARLLCLLRVARLVISVRLARETSLYYGDNFKMFRQKLREIAAHVRGVVLAEKAARESQRLAAQDQREDAKSRCLSANSYLHNYNVGGSKDYDCTCGFCHTLYLD